MPTSQSLSKAAISKKRGRLVKRITIVVLTVASLIATAVGTKDSANIADRILTIVSALKGVGEIQNP